MSELTLVGLHEDGEHVVLEGPDGQRFRLPIDDALRAAVRRDRAQLEQVRSSGALPPREIQARIRAGATAEQVADEAGVAVALVRRYEGPVLAEREHVAAQARATRIGRDADAPTLGDLVADRLATRGVETGTTAWDASRGPSGPWTVEVTFVVHDATRSARWTFDLGARTVRAVDDEARWLSETELTDEPIPRRHLAAVRDGVFDVEVDDALRPLLASVDLTPVPLVEPEDDPHAATHALLDDLGRRRGVRQPVDEDAEDDDAEEFEGFGPQHAFDFEHPGLTTDVPSAHPPASRPDLATDATVLPLPPRAAEPAPRTEPTAPAASAPAASAPAPSAPSPSAPTGAGAPPAGAEEPGSRRAARKGRASVPSWDEIVFGAKPE